VHECYLSPMLAQVPNLPQLLHLSWDPCIMLTKTGVISQPLSLSVSQLKYRWAALDEVPALLAACWKYIR
jgi:hypothetical protein